MRELIPAIEGALGAERLGRLRRDEDAYQQFWLGVLEALPRVDWSREALGYLISSGYGAVRNMRRAEDSRSRMRVCPGCGAHLGNRTRECPRCGRETDGAVRVSYLARPDGSDLEVVDERHWPSPDLRVDVEAFMETLSGREAYVARRWLVERADLTCQNHVRQIAFEMGVSQARVSQLKAKVRDQFRGWYFE